ncbi:uncharacterized protein C2845_PM05G35120 [Panicum miliaceum]|uniref:Mitochondrial adenine nucleotide transporter BTL3 n=1 Tax=Panicum miliaceum TaxID=4540 RepID=A0A3L6T277_PANMI|nr:uncharacterized protein C2845_PM05G35120 [Panicum miliaceum]
MARRPRRRQGGGGGGGGRRPALTACEWLLPNYIVCGINCIELDSIELILKQGMWLLEHSSAITDIGKKGNLPQVIRIIPYSAVPLFSYEVYKKVFRRKDGELSVFGRLAAGVCGGMISTLVTYPLDVLRLRLAVQSGHSTMSQVALNMLRLREEGLASFYGGLGPSLIAFAPYITAVAGCIHSQQSQNFCEHALVGYTIGQASERCADLQVLEFI